MSKKYRPTTPGLRGTIIESHEQLTLKSETGRAKVDPCRRLLKPKKRTGGRNNLGRITCRHRGGGHKQQYRLVDFRREKEDIPARVASIEYDPNRSAYIALLNYADGEKRYILAPKGLQQGDMVSTASKPPYRVGICMKLKDMPLGSVVHNIELVPGRGGKMARAAGTSVQLMARSDGFATLKMPSGEVRIVREECRATFGTVSNSEHSQRVEGKAGRSRWQGIRPTVRGTAMNPVDHPHGGGEGRQNGYIPKTPWGQVTKGRKTRNKRKSMKMIVKDRRK